MPDSDVTACRPAAILATLALFAGTGGCGRDPVSPLTPADVTGAYALATLGGQPVPLVLPRTDGTTTMVADTLTLRADGIWAKVSVTQPTGDPARRAVNRYSGTWQLDGQRSAVLVTSYPERGGPSTLTYLVRDRGRGLTFGADGGESVYARLP